MNPSNPERTLSPEANHPGHSPYTENEELSLKEFSAMDLDEDAQESSAPEAALSHSDGVSTGISNAINDEDEEEILIRSYKQKIIRLAKKQLESDDLDENTHINQFIAQLKLSIQQLESKNKRDSNHNKIIDIPFFQLVDDPLNAKSENARSYDNAETFVSTFEMILETNDVDINETWKKHLPKAFLFSKNEKHHRWYTQNINNLDDNTMWDVVKAKIIDRFGNSANMANKIEKYLDLQQGKQESIRDYIDRYLETYSRLPNNKRPSDSIEAMKFIKSGSMQKHIYQQPYSTYSHT
ncbi:hypothetical protein MFLAVUS_011475 [Mucor flavus]|uniref:Retrotransposon gag domain-containing protein n=1 Tax=Mucor flavus TaxID=439312 RepID=A0ABP9ZFK8_9FUNG